MSELSTTLPFSSSATSQSGDSGSAPVFPSETRISNVVFLRSSIIGLPFSEGCIAQHLNPSKACVLTPGLRFVNSSVIISASEDGENQAHRIAIGSDRRTAQRRQIDAVQSADRRTSIDRGRRAGHHP